MILDCGKQTIKTNHDKNLVQAHPSETDVKSSYLSSFNGADSVSPCMGGHGTWEELLKPKHCIKSRSMGLHTPWVEGSRCFGDKQGYGQKTWDSLSQMRPSKHLESIKYPATPHRCPGDCGVQGSLTSFTPTAPSPHSMTNIAFFFVSSLPLENEVLILVRKGTLRRVNHRAGAGGWAERKILAKMSVSRFYGKWGLRGRVPAGRQRQVDL